METKTSNPLVCGKLSYKGRTYYVASNRVGKPAHTDKYGGKTLVHSFDGKLEFWAQDQLCSGFTPFRSPKSLQSIRDFVEDRKAGNTAVSCGARSSGPTKRCWECGGSFTYQDAKQAGGDWQDSYCGC